MKLAVPIDHLRPGKGGLETWLFALARHLTSRGDEVHSITMDPTGPGEPFRHHFLPPRGWTRAVRDRGFAETARRFTGTGEFDVVLGVRHLLACDVYSPRGGSIEATFAARRRVKRLPSLPSARVANFLSLERQLLAGPEPPRFVIAVSNSVRDDHARRYPGIADRIRVVPNGVDLVRFSPEGRDRTRTSLGLEEGRTLLFAAGNPRLKGFAFVRKAFETLRSSGKAEHLLVIGGRPGRLPAGARYLGSLADPVDAFRAADVLVHPTFYDPFPFVVLEALACGTPVVTTRENGALPHVGEGESVRAVKAPEDTTGLVREIRSVLDTAPREDARRRAEAFPRERSLEATIALLDEASVRA